MGVKGGGSRSARVKREEEEGTDDNYGSEDSQNEFLPSSMSARKLAWLLRSLADTADQFEK